MTQPPPADFNFPGTPYPVQQRLMTALHSAIESRQIGLFESPTGTGKTLSIICATLTWLQHNRYAAAPRPCATHDADEPDWVVAHSRSLERRNADDAVLRRKHAYVRRLRNSKRTSAGEQPKRRRATRDHDDPFSESDDDTAPNQAHQRSPAHVRVIFATRTHSQLTQFLEELRKTPFCPPDATSSDAALKVGLLRNELPSPLPLSVMLFGSRKQFCINDEVRALSSSAAISERCRELTEVPQLTGAAKRKRTRNTCQYKNNESEAILRDRALVQMYSIEELADSGKALRACPYFATRNAIETAEVDVIGVPYSAVLHAPTRESLGVTVDQNTVVVFDEAHNITNTVCDLHSAVLTRPALVRTIAALNAYIERYESRFTPTNLYKLRQLVTLAKGLLSLLPARGKQPGKARVVRPSAMLFDAGIDNINMYALVAYMEESRLCKKLRGFVDGGAGVRTDSGKKRDSAPAQNASEEKTLLSQRAVKQGVTAFENFVRCAADCAEYGRVALYPFRTPPEEKRSDDALPSDMTARLKYFVVQPGTLFADTMKQARAILLVGGTLSPRAAIKERLLKGLEKGVVEFECDHVVPAENVMTRICGSGPTGTTLEFTYKTRQGFEVCDELARAVERCLSMAEGGVVMFLSSYELLRKTLARWRATRALEKLEAVKPVFVEERGTNDAFSAYKSKVKEDGKRGALLAAVMGGKLSEGINFSDDLGRMVIMVGMPFANAAQVETGEVLKGVEGAKQRSEFLENECLTVVNQCIGRAVRHRRDFANIVLMDRRYGRDRAITKLPAFVRRDIGISDGFERLEQDVRAFFSRHR